MRILRSICLFVAVALAVAGTPAGAGVPLTVTLAPSPAVVGDTVTVTPDQPCPGPTDGMMVEVLVDTPDGSDLILNTTADGAGAWTLDFVVDQVGEFDVIASCIYVSGNIVYQAAALTVTEALSTTAAPPTEPPSTAAPTTGSTTEPIVDPGCALDASAPGCAPAPAEPQPEPATFTG